MLPSLHLVVPAYNPGGAFDVFLPELLGALAETGCVHRVQVVDDGSAPEERHRILETAARLAGRFPSLAPVLVLPANRGKGAAIRAGWELGGHAAWLGFVDADGSVPASQVVRLWRMSAGAVGNTCLLASRIRSAGHTVQRRWHRHVLGRIFARTVQRALDLPVYDTQCGLKLLPTPAYRVIAAGLRENRFAFDVELLVRLRAAGCTLAEEPIDWADRGKSTVRLWRDGPAMFGALWRIRRRGAGAGPANRGNHE